MVVVAVFTRWLVVGGTVGVKEGKTQVGDSTMQLPSGVA